MAQESNPVLTGGNGVHQFFSVNGYVDSTSGCEDQNPDNPNIKPGRDHTFTVIGNMWLENGVLRTDAPATGVLHRDGSFRLDYPRIGPSALRAIDGRIGAPNPGGLDAPISGTWTAPYPNGTSTCLTHWVITSGHVNLTQGGFGVPLGTRAKTGGSDHGGGLPLVPIGAGVVALFGIGGLLTWVKTRPRRCDCDFTVTIEGPNRVEFCDCVTDEHWFLEYLPKFPGSKEYPEDWRKLGVATPGDPSKSTELGAAKYHARVNAKCTGAGAVEATDYTWTLSSPTVDATDRKRRGKIQVTVRATIKCPDAPARQLSRAGQVAFEPKAECCGPEFTDAYVAALNRVLERIPLEFPADKRIAQIRWFQKNGPFMMVRPFGDLQTVGEAAAGCPSNDDCVNTATLLGRCVDLWCTDAVVWGAVTGRAGMTDWQRDGLEPFRASRRIEERRPTVSKRLATPDRHLGAATRGSGPCRWAPPVRLALARECALSRRPRRAHDQAHPAWLRGSRMHASVSRYYPAAIATSRASSRRADALSTRAGWLIARAVSVIPPRVVLVVSPRVALRQCARPLVMSAKNRRAGAPSATTAFGRITDTWSARNSRHQSRNHVSREPENGAVAPPRFRPT